MLRSLSSNTNDSMWKLLFGLSGLIVGALIGASMPELVFSPSKQSTNSSSTQSNDKEDEPSLCSGPECMSAPTAKVPSNIQVVNLPNNYLSACLQITANQSATQSINQSNNQTIDEAETFALMLGAVSQYSNYQSVKQSLSSNRLADLVTCLTSQGYTVTESVDQSMTALRSSIQAGKSLIVTIQSSRQPIDPSINQSGDEIDWLKVDDSARRVLVVGYDSFYIYLLDCDQSIHPTNNLSFDLLYCPAREFSRRWHSVDQSNERVTGQMICIESPMAPVLTKEEAKKTFSNAKLKQLI